MAETFDEAARRIAREADNRAAEVLDRGCTSLEWQEFRDKEFFRRVSDWLAEGQEPLGWIPEDTLKKLKPPRIRLLGVPFVTYSAEGHVPVFLHPAPADPEKASEELLVSINVGLAQSTKIELQAFRINELEMQLSRMTSDRDAQAVRIEELESENRAITCVSDDRFFKLNDQHSEIVTLTDIEKEKENG